VNGAQGCRGAQVQPPASNPAASVDKRLGPLRCSKGPSKLSLPTFPTPRTLCQLQQQGIQKLYPQCPPTLDGWGYAKAQGSKVNPLDGSEPPRATRARDKATHEGIRHPQASYLSPEQEVSSCGLASSHPDFPLGLSGKDV
jgi:hypothetical protein